MIKICHICSYYENILYDNLISAQRECVEPKVFYFKKYGSVKQYNKDYVDEVNCFSELDRLFFYIKEKKAYDAYIRTYSDTRFDLNFAHSLFVNGYLAYRLKQRFGVPYVVMVQNTDLNVFFKYRKHLKNTGIKVLLNADKIIFASEVYKDELIDKYVPLKYHRDILNKAAVVPYGIENIFFSDQQIRYDNPEKPVELLSVGLICNNKNHLRVCKAIQLLRDEGYDLRLTIIGKAANEKISKKIVQYDFVSVLPFMPKEQLINHYRSCHIFILASLTETFGLVYAEALSQGLPIIYTKGQGFDGQFPEGKVGYHVDARSKRAIADGILKTISNYRTLAKETVAASDRFRWDLISQSYFDIYKEIIEKD